MVSSFWHFKDSAWRLSPPQWNNCQGSFHEKHQGKLFLCIIWTFQDSQTSIWNLSRQQAISYAYLSSWKTWWTARTGAKFQFRSINVLKKESQSFLRCRFRNLSSLMDLKLQRAWKNWDCNCLSSLLEILLRWWTLLLIIWFTHASRKFHKSFIEVNEEGTYRSCCCFLCSYNGWKCKTTLSTTSTSMFYIADHPFIFMVKEEVSYILLFTGTVRKP